MKIDLGEGLQLSTCENEQKVYLTNGKEQTLACKIRATVPDAISQKQIILSAEYGYFIDKETSIRVLPAPSPGE